MGSIDRRVDSTGRVRWRARYRGPDRKQHGRTFAKKGDAERWLREVETTVDRGAWIDPAGQRVTFQAWVDEYTRITPKRATTAARDRAVLRTWWLPALGPMPLGRITPAHVRKVVDQMTAKLAPKTVATNYGVARAVFRAAVDHERIATSPCRAIRLPAARRVEQRFVTVEELLRIVEALPEPYRPVAWLGGVLGLRLSEITGLRAGRIDLARRTITIDRTTSEVEGKLRENEDTKTASSRRTLVMPARVADELAAHLERTGRTGPDDYVVQAPRGGPLRATQFRNRVWRPAVERAGLPGLTIHQLRHSAVGLLITEGAHATAIQQRLGHASIRTTIDVYGHLLPEVDRGTADLLDTALARVHAVSTAPGEPPGTTEPHHEGGA